MLGWVHYKLNTAFQVGTQCNKWFEMLIKLKQFQKK